MKKQPILFLTNYKLEQQKVQTDFPCIRSTLLECGNE